MKAFMEMLWDSVGCEITGKRHDGSGFRGDITNVRMKFGNDLSVTVWDLDTNETFLVDGSDIFEGKRNLRVHF